ncbi:MAG: hypothetical protein JRF37_04120 [Deltaproteobacteria bacterium]|nr:hypothetical protein [Deltaproteobacteria bacterium]
MTKYLISMEIGINAEDEGAVKAKRKELDELVSGAFKDDELIDVESSIYDYDDYYNDDDDEDD